MISGTAHDDVWAVGGGTLLHFDGQAWSTVASPSSDNAPLAVFALARDNVWVTSRYGRVARWDGTAWTEYLSLPGIGHHHVDQIWGTGPLDIWVHGYCWDDLCGSRNSAAHWDGSAWTAVPPGAGPVGFEGSTPDNGWGFTGDELFHWDGTSWRSLGTFRPRPRVLLATPEGYHAADGHMMLRWSDGAWGTLDGSPKQVFRGDVRRIVQRAPDDVWAVGEYGLALHFDGVRWAPVATGTTENLVGVTGISPVEAWAVGASSIFHWEGTSWASEPSPVARLEDVWGAAADDVWAVADGSLLHYDGTRWSKYADPLPAFQPSIRGTSPQDVWVVSDRSQVWHWDGVSWTHRPTVSTTPHNGLWVGAVDDVWTTRGGGWVTRWDGTAWKDFFTGTAGDLGHVTGSGRSDVWALFNSGGLLRWDGASWSQHVPPVWPIFRTIESRAPGEVWIGGAQGRILRYTP